MLKAAVIKTLRNILLCALMLVLSVSAYAEPQDRSLPVFITTARIKAVAGAFSGIPQEFINEISGRSVISRQEFESLAYRHNLKSQFLQRFFGAHFVFKGKDGVEYIPVDSSIPRHNYDFSGLRYYSNGETKYFSGVRETSLKGIDVSSFQGAIDWPKVKEDGVQFAFIRLGFRGYGSGQLNLDTRFEENYKGATEAGIDVGVYFYSQAIGAEEAREEAEFVLKALGGRELSYPVVFDIEDANSTSGRTNRLSKREATDGVLAFCERVEEVGYRGAVYANTSWFVSRLELKRLLGYEIWLAQYYGQPFFPYEFQYWQYTSVGRVKGIEGGVDMNLRFR